MVSCPQCHNNFEVTQDYRAFLARVGPRIGEKHLAFPEPSLCPACREQLRTLHRNEATLHSRHSDLSGKAIISIYAPSERCKVYTPEEWWSDKWEGLEYGRDFDFGRSFFAQFAELQASVPRIALINLNNENCPYTTGTAYSKNCHMINSAEYCDGCMYGKVLQRCRDCQDCNFVYDSELCYECFQLQKCYGCVYLSYSQDCSNCWFSESLNGCTDCLFCSNLTRKTLHIFNRPCSRAEFSKALAELQGQHSNFEAAKQTFRMLRSKRAHKYAEIYNCEECTGDVIRNSKNCKDCYDVTDSQDCRYVGVGVKARDVYDASNIYIDPELCFQVLGVIGTHNCAFCLYTFHSRDIFYSEQIYNSQNLFGCVGLKNKQYCILNRQYSKPEYEALVPRIVAQMRSGAEWGHFFPAASSPFGYNETLAQEYYPLSRIEVANGGFNWFEETAEQSAQMQTEQIPEKTIEIDDSLTAKIFACEVSGRAFKFMAPELEFYRKMNLPAPRRAPFQRAKDRLEFRNPRKVWARNCSGCKSSVLSVFNVDTDVKVLCETCFSAEIA